MRVVSVSKLFFFSSSKISKFEGLVLSLSGAFVSKATELFFRNAFSYFFV